VEQHQSDHQPSSDDESIDRSQQLFTQPSEVFGPPAAFAAAATAAASTGDVLHSAAPSAITAVDADIPPHHLLHTYPIAPSTIISSCVATLNRKRIAVSVAPTWLYMLCDVQRDGVLRTPLFCETGRGQLSRHTSHNKTPEITDVKTQ
jgi:hypothetical protein